MLKLPISFKSDGTMSSIAEGTDEYYATLLSNTLQIEAGELPMSQLYGVKDPSFNTKSVADSYVRQAAQFVQEITVTEVSSVRANDEGNISLGIKFTVRN